MAWQEPKTDWQANPKNPMAEDFNRIEGNVDFLKTDIETKKGAIVDALNTVGLASELADTHATLASRITGSNQGTKIITPGTTNQTIAKGFHSGSGYVKGDANLIAGNIKKGVNIFGVMGSVSTTVVGQQNSNYVRVSSDYQTVSSSVSLTNAGVVFGAACFTEQSGGTPRGCKLFINNVEVASGGGRWSPIVAGYRAASAGTGTAKAQHTSGSTGSLANLEVYVFGASV